MKVSTSPGKVKLPPRVLITSPKQRSWGKCPFVTELCHFTHGKVSENVMTNHVIDGTKLTGILRGKRFYTARLRC